MPPRNDAIASARRDRPVDQNGRRLAAIVESAFDAIIAKTLDGEITSWNRAAERLYGYSAEEAIGQSISIIVPEDRQAELEEIFLALNRRERVEPFETCRISKDGQRHDVSLTVSPITGEGDEIVGASSISRNITKHKREHARQKMEHAVTRILSSASSITEVAAAVLKALLTGMECDFGELWIHDEARDILVRVDSVAARPTAALQEFDRWSRTIEFARGEGLPGRVWTTGQPEWFADISAESDFARAGRASAAGLRCAMAFQIGAGEDIHGVMAFFTTKLLTPDESFLDSMKAIGNEIGLFIRHMKLDAERANLASIIESSSDAIFAWSCEGAITSWNPQAERVFGRLEKDMIGASIYEVIPKDAAKRAKRLIKSSVKERPGGSLGEICLRNRDKELRLSLSVSPVNDHTGKLVGFSTIARDVSARQKIENALRCAKEDAERSNRVKSEFLATMSHEIRTPLNGVLMTAQMLLLGELNPKQREYAEILLDSGEQLVHLLDDLLDLSKIESGHWDLTERTFNLRDLLDALTSIWEGRAGAKGLDFFVTIQPGMSLQRRGDDCRIRQVLENLISNAVKYTDHGYIAVRASIERIGGSKETLRFEIKDTGRGIEPEDQRRLFTRFERGECPPEDMPEGSGLGLAICKEIVDRMGGRIGVDSRPGRGSTFWVSLAMKTVESLPANRLPLTAPAPVPRPARRGSPLRILVADDNATNRKLLADILASAGHSIELAADGLEAVEAARKVRYDLIFMDIRMPEMDGVTATREIRSHSAIGDVIPIVAVTANAMRGDREKYVEAGLTDYIAKPFNMHDVLAVVNKVVGPQTTPMMPN